MAFFSNTFILGKWHGGIFSSGGQKKCNIYVFHSTDADRLDLAAPFTGNLKVIVAGLAVTGLHPDIVAGLTSAWVDSTDLTNPVWNYSEISAVSLAYIVDNTFDGIVAKYAKDNVWYSVDMGKPEARLYYDFDGIAAYGQLPTPISIDDANPLEIDFEFKSGAYTRRILGSSTQTLTQIRIDTATNNRIRLLYDGTFLSFNNALDGLVDGNIYTLRVAMSGNMHEIFIDGVSKGMGTATITTTPLFDMIAVDDATPSSYYVGIIANIKSGDGSVNHLIMDDGVGGIFANLGTGGNAVLFNEVTGDWIERIL